MPRAIDRHYFSQIDSTNSWSKRQVGHFHRDRITLVLAGEQTAGRGRQERRWLSPLQGNLYASYTFFVPNTRQDITNGAQAVAAQVAETLNAGLKWPNDLLLSGKKVGGVLCETTPIDDLIAVIVGLGININMSQEWLDQLPIQATSLSIEQGRPVDAEVMMETLNEEACHAIDLFIDKGFAPFINTFRQHIVHRLGDPIEFHLGEHILQGTFHSINDDGTLNLILESGMRTFASGEMLA